MNGSRVNYSAWIGGLIAAVLAVSHPQSALCAPNGGTPTVAQIPIPIDDDLSITIPVLINVPPDPGAAGTATLAGIDANNNGVRDDLERQVVRFYPNNAQARGYMYEMAKAYQSVLLNRASVATVVANYGQLMQMQFCLEQVVGLPTVISKDLLPYLLNTYERGLAYVDMLTLIETVGIPPRFFCP